MPVETVKNLDWLVSHIRCQSKSPSEQLAEAVELLDSYTLAIENAFNTGDKSYYYPYTVDLTPSPSGLMSSLGFKRSAPDPASYVDPFSDEKTAEFWRCVADEPSLHVAVKSWLISAVRLIKFAEAAPYYQAGLWESELTQFAESAATSLALANKDFVPYYARLLAVWDLDHEVNQPQTIRAIIKKWGICPETEYLIFVNVAVNLGYGGFELLIDISEQLDNSPSPFEKSDLFNKIVDYSYYQRLKDTEDQARKPFSNGMKLFETFEMDFSNLGREDLAVFAQARLRELKSMPFEKGYETLLGSTFYE